MTAPLLELGCVSAGYGRLQALSEVSLSLAPGCAMALLGANGAGKTTLLKTVLGLVPATAGTLRFDGRDVGPLAPAARARLGIGYAPEGRRPFPGLTVRENLEVAARARGSVRRRRLGEVYALFPQLAERAGTPGWQLSGGQQQMLAVGRALMGAPRLLLLDEPSLGLAPALVHDLMARLKTVVAGGVAVLFAEQNAAHARTLADRVCLMRLGRVVRAGGREMLEDRAALGATFFGE